MKKLLSVICSGCVLLASCKDGGGREKAVAVKDSVADTTRNDAAGKGVKDKILGLWAAVGDENATFEIGKDQITYPDENASYKYVVSGDSIHIRFDGFSGDYKVRKRGADTLVFVGDEEQVYYRFSAGAPAINKVKAGRPASLEILSRQWKNDSLGCEHIRGIDAFNRLVKGYALTQKNEVEWLKVLGAPNDVEKYADKTIVIFYFGSVCGEPDRKGVGQVELQGEFRSSAAV
ncbi:MAG TPA: hypothetical protein VNW04_06285 [Puia sp.]|nr:hypothetical protein [Puia sp.]